MNSEILKFANQHLVHERFSRYGESTEEDYYEFYPDELQTFIKFIVQNCLLALEPDSMSNNTLDYAVEEKLYQRSADKIIKHIGIDQL